MLLSGFPGFPPGSPLRDEPLSRNSLGFAGVRGLSLFGDSESGLFLCPVVMRSWSPSSMTNDLPWTGVHSGVIGLLLSTTSDFIYYEVTSY